MVVNLSFVLSALRIVREGFRLTNFLCSGNHMSEQAWLEKLRGAIHSFATQVYGRAHFFPFLIVHRLPLYCSLSVQAFLFRLRYMPVRDWSTPLCSDRKVPQIQKAVFSSSMLSQMTDMLWYQGVCLGTEQIDSVSPQSNTTAV